jgi:diaminopimelate epimerase
VEIPFIKIQGLGNDYIFVDKKSFQGKKVKFPSLARLVSDRNHGIGSDGLIVMERLDADSASMAIYNGDGSQARFCGNGLRGTALYLKTVNREKRKKYFIYTDWNEYQIEFLKVDDKFAIVKADIGAPSFDSRLIGLNKVKNPLGIEIKTSYGKRLIYCLAMPNPQAVIFVDNFKFDWQNEGRELGKSSIFKNGINVMFTKINSSKRISVMPWERGSGATLACGSGAAAASVISHLLGYTGSNVAISMPGGSLLTRWDINTNRIIQEGPTRIVFSGKFFL